MECPRCHTELPDNAAFCHRCGGEVDGALEPSDYRYAAFISYRHLPHDTEIAKQVQHAVETFRMPRGVSGSTFPDWPRPGKPLGNCFRDEDELSATHSLPESIQRALAQSRSLVVVCSPQTEESPWVRQEIEMFAQLHGRNRIICILASGSSDESIPPALKTRLMPDSQGVMREMPSQPLAADLRAPSKSQRKLELLRIIAAVAGCNFDDLRRRQRARKHRRIAIASLAAAALVALIAALVFATASSTQSALIAESKNLAAASRDQFAHGDRMAAIETALSALPSSEADRSRPLVPEAQEALEDALLVYDDLNNRFRPYFIIDGPSEIVTFVADEYGEWIATLDDNGIIRGYSGTNGKERYSIDLREYTAQPDNFSPASWNIAATPASTLIAGSNIEGGGLVSFDGSTGEFMWGYGKTQACAICPSEHEDYVAIFGTDANGTTSAGITNTTTGELLGGGQSTSLTLETDQVPPFFPKAFSMKEGAAVISSEGTTACFDFSKGDCVYLPLGGLDSPNSLLVSSLFVAPGMILAALSCEDPAFFEDPSFVGDNVPCGFAAIDYSSENPEPIWEYEATYNYTAAGYFPNSVVCNSMPRIQCLVGGEELAAICTAGQTLSVRSCATGEEILHEEFRGSVIRVRSLCEESYDENGADIFFVVTSNGTIDVQAVPSPWDSFYDDAHCDLPNIVDRAEILLKPADATMVAAHAADQTNRILVYGCRTSGYAREGSLSLDQLIGIAHWLLAAE